MAILQLCVSQIDNQTPFLFKIINVKVFSLEEALFVVYYNWKNTADELFTPEFINWVKNNLMLPEIAGKINGYAQFPYNDRLTSFLRVIDYFDESEINSLKKELDVWAKRVAWEKLKDRGDYFTSRGMPEKAVSLYKKALDDSRQPRLLNNLAVALLHMENYADSAVLLKEALEIDPDNIDLKLNYAEVCVCLGKTGEAKAILEELPPSVSAFRLLGELYGRTGDSEKALENLKTAAELDDSADNIYRLADFYIGASEFDSAVSAVNRIKAQDARTAIKRADICNAQSDFTSAANILEKAVIAWPNDAELWLALSECSRNNGNAERASQAITKASALQPDNVCVKLETVKVKRVQNNVRAYQETLLQLINSLKDEYRDAEEVLSSAD